MNRKKQQRLRRHPLIRFLRAIIRIGRVFFKPSRKKISVSQPEQSPRFDPPLDDLQDRPIIIEAPKLSLTDPYLTVEELLGLVQWELPAPVMQSIPATTQPKKTAVRSIEHGGIQNISKVKPQDQFITVGELFELVQWKAAASPNLVAMSTVSIKDRPLIQDFSRN
jgi:hypothetical protein